MLLPKLTTVYESSMSWILTTTSLIVVMLAFVLVKKN